MNWLEILGAISSGTSLLILIWQVYKQVLEDCKHNPHDMTDIQRTDELHRKISEIHGIVKRGNIRRNSDLVSD
jgi:hypothetical protein